MKIREKWTQKLWGKMIVTYFPYDFLLALWSWRCFVFCRWMFRWPGQRYKWGFCSARKDLLVYCARYQCATGDVCSWMIIVVFAVVMVFFVVSPCDLSILWVSTQSVEAVCSYKTFVSYPAAERAGPLRNTA